MTQNEILDGDAAYAHALLRLEQVAERWNWSDDAYADALDDLAAAYEAADDADLDFWGSNADGAVFWTTAYEYALEWDEAGADDLRELYAAAAGTVYTVRENELDLEDVGEAVDDTLMDAGEIAETATETAKNPLAWIGLGAGALAAVLAYLAI